MRYALTRPFAAGAITLVVASSWSTSAALAGCAATALSASAGIFGPPSISATESSTAQALELIRQRRMQVAEACPTGFTRAGGICQPVAQNVVEPVAAPAPAPVAEAAPGASGTPAPKASSAAAARAKASTPAPRPRTTVASAPPPSDGKAPAYDGGLKDYGVAAVPAGRVIGSWIEGYADWERHDNIRPDRPGGEQHRESYSTGILSGLDATDVPRGIQLGILGGYNYTQSKFSPITGPRRENDDGSIVNGTTFNAKTAIEGTSLGLYGSYFAPNGFSADLMYKVDLFDLTQDESIASVGGCGTIRIFHNHGETTMTNHIVASNLAYRYDIGGGRWLEPTIGLRYTHTDVGGNAVNLGLEDGDALRVQGGVRLGHAFMREGWLVTTGLTGLLYSDVLVDGFVLPGLGTPPGVAEIDEGKLRVMGIAEAKFDNLKGTIWYGQIDLRGGEDLIGVGGKIGVRMRW